MRQLRHTSLREGNFRAYASESESHIRKKFEVWLKLKKAGYLVWTEVIFKKGFRMDILAFREGGWICYEIIESESKKSLLKKVIKYPVDIVPIVEINDIKKLKL